VETIVNSLGSEKMSTFIRIGQKIQEYLDRSGATQSDLADQIGVSKQVMHKIIHGKKAINVQEISLIAAAIQVSVDELLREDVPSRAEPFVMMMGSVSNPNTKDDLRLLNHVMDEMLALEKLLEE
jgi:transcriptional regulator with XRE-family HTH domain